MLSLINLTLSARVGGRQVDLLRDISFTVERGKVLGLVGESGAGKSMIGRLVAGHVPAGFQVTKGRVLFDGGELLSMSPTAWRHLLGRRIAFIPQEPLTALNPVLTIGQTFDEHLMLLGVPSGKRSAMIVEQLGSVQLPKPAEIARRYPHELSGGQCQRVLIAMAFSANPSLIIADEPTTALDVVSQARVMSLLGEQQRRHETAVVLITHDLRLAAHVCDEIAVLYAGEQVEYGPAADVLNRPRHPYTVALRDATPDVSGERRLLPSLRGQMPGLSVLATMPGCRFAPRCPTRNAACESATSSLREVAPGHQVRCAESCQVRVAGVEDIALAMAADRPAEPFIASVERPPGSAMAAPPVGDALAAPVVELRDVTLSYVARRGLFGQTRVRNDAVSRLSLAVQPGEFVGIVGESGSGKSSVARLIVGSERATSGSVIIEGQDRARADAAFLRLAREHVQMIFQDPHSALNPRRSVYTLLTQAFEVAGASEALARSDAAFAAATTTGPAHAQRGHGPGQAFDRPAADGPGDPYAGLPAHLAGDITQPEIPSPAEGQRQRRADELLRDIGLPPDCLERFPNQLSGGQKQRVNIGRALCVMPRLLVADEIVSGLDVSVQAQVLNLLLELGRRHGVALLLISHDLSVVRYLCSRVIVMQAGKVVEEGRTDEVFANPHHAYTRLLLAAVPPADATVTWPPVAVVAPNASAAVPSEAAA